MSCGTSRVTLRRVWTFARPYRRAIFFFLGTIVLDALISLVAPFAFRRILDHSIPTKNRSEITILACRPRSGGESHDASAPVSSVEDIE